MYLRTWSGKYAVSKTADVGNRFYTDCPATGPNNAYLVKRKTAGGVQFSRDPLNLMNKHSRKVESVNSRTLRDDR